MKLVAIPVIFCLSIFTSVNALADGAAVEGEAASVAEGTPNQASDASFDKRLPPVLPGEQVNDSGRKMKVWSTAGPVPVSSAPPEPYQENQIRNTERIMGGGVIIDRR